MFQQCTCSCNHPWRGDIKSKNILVYLDALSFGLGCRWLGERIRLWNCIEHISGRNERLQVTIGKNCADVTRKQICVIWDTSNNNRREPNKTELRSSGEEDMAGCREELLGSSTQFSSWGIGRSSGNLRNFFGEDTACNKRHWQENMCSFLEEDMIRLQGVVGKNCAILGDSLGQEARSPRHNYAVSRLSEEQGNRASASQNCAIFRWRAE